MLKLYYIIIESVLRYRLQLSEHNYCNNALRQPYEWKVGRNYRLIIHKDCFQLYGQCLLLTVILHNNNHV